MTAFRNQLLTQNWGVVYEEEDTDKADDKFLTIFKLLYDKTCPIKRYSNKHNYTDNPWITKGLQNGRKKENSLYRKFIMCKTKKAENKYKI